MIELIREALVHIFRNSPDTNNLKITKKILCVIIQGVGIRISQR